jgi:hypothetical protein
VSDGALIELCPDTTVFEGGIVVDRVVTIRSTSGDPATTILDGSATDSSVFLVDGGDSPSTA